MRRFIDNFISVLEENKIIIFMFINTMIILSTILEVGLKILKKL